jgi:Zn-dependent peptidase ImmA (M78 family)
MDAALSNARVDKTTCSQNRSELVRLFVLRSGTPEETPATVVRAHIASLQRRVNKKRSAIAVEHYFAARGIRAVESTTNRLLDGFLKPLGNAYNDGFILHVNGDASAARRKFTIAHEICHTFFYEVVPELKFVDHAIDPEEERLCDVGAAELLMPEGSVKRLASQQTVGLEALDRMAEHFGVSVHSMLIRLETLNLWKARLWAWRRLDDGSVTLSDHYSVRGIRRWSWADQAVASKIWSAKERTYISGRTFIEYRDANGAAELLPIYYDARRIGNTLTVLLTARKRKEVQSERTLFVAKARR